MSQMWNAQINLGVQITDEDVLGMLHEYLIEYSPAVGVDLSGNLSIRIFIQASTAAMGLQKAIREVTAATVKAGLGDAIVGAEVITEGELDRRLVEFDLVGVSEIGKMFQVSRQRAAQLVRRQDFPSAVARVSAGPVFCRRQVESFGEAWDRRPGRRSKIDS